MARESEFRTYSPSLSLNVSLNALFEEGCGSCPEFVLYSTLPAAALRRFKSPGESFELGLDTILSRLVVEPFSDSTVMVIPDVPDAPSAVVGQTHLA